MLQKELALKEEKRKLSQEANVAKRDRNVLAKAKEKAESKVKELKSEIEMLLESNQKTNEMNKRLSDNNKKYYESDKASQASLSKERKTVMDHLEISKSRMHEINSLRAENKKLKEHMTNNAKGQDFLEYLEVIERNIEEDKTTIRLLSDY